MPDEELASIIAGDSSEEACAELFRRYNKKIYMWCFTYTHDVDEALDCAQEILIRIFRNIGSFSKRARLSTWVYRVTRNYCLDQLSSRKKQWQSRLLRLEERDAGSRADEDLARNFEISEDLGRFLERAGKVLKEDEMEAFILHYRDGMRVREITSILGCENVTGARTLIQNARRKFRNMTG